MTTESLKNGAENGIQLLQQERIRATKGEISGKRNIFDESDDEVESDNNSRPNVESGGDGGSFENHADSDNSFNSSDAATNHSADSFELLIPTPPKQQYHYLISMNNSDTTSLEDTDRRWILKNEIDISTCFINKGNSLVYQCTY